ncbi:hypothetical protein CR513_55017, partial [Mucuna pruriens]
MDKIKLNTNYRYIEVLYSSSMDLYFKASVRANTQDSMLKLTFLKCQFHILWCMMLSEILSMKDSMQFVSMWPLWSSRRKFT